MHNASFLRKLASLYNRWFQTQPHTTQDVLVSMTEDWRRAIDHGKLVGAAMVDLSKAFDLVQHDILHAEKVGEIWSTGR